MREIIKILTDDNQEFSCELDAKHYLQSKAEHLYIEIFRDLDTLPSRTTKLLWLTDNHKLIVKFADLLTEISEGV